MAVRITKNTVTKELAALKEAGPEAMREFVEEMTLATHDRAIKGIKRGPATGRVYEKYRPRRTHQASAPGQYPQSDTGRLASSIQFELPTSTTAPEGVIGTNLQYGKHLELKPAALGGRPWLLRAFNEATQQAEKLLAKVFRRRGRL